MPERVTTRRVGSPSAESTRFPGEGQSAQGQSGPKTRPKGVVDGQTVNIPSPGGEVERGRTPEDSRVGVVDAPVPQGRQHPIWKLERIRPRKAPSGRSAGPYRNPTQVCQVRIRRRSGEPS